MAGVMDAVEHGVSVDRLWIGDVATARLLATRADRCF